MALRRSGASLEPDVSVVIVHRDTPEHLRRCLAQVTAAAGEVTLEVVVVDDGSVPALRADLKPRRGLTVMLNETMRGFAAAANQGAAVARGHYALFLDPGVRLEADAIAALVELMRADSRLAALGPAWDDGEGVLRIPARPPVTPLGYTLELLGRKRRYSAVNAQPEPLLDVPSVGRSALLINAAVFRAVAGFDEALRSAVDQDWCWRASRRGYRIAVASRVGAAHMDEDTLPREATGAQVHCSHLRVLTRCSGARSTLLYRVGVSTALLLNAAIAACSQRSHAASSRGSRAASSRRGSHAASSPTSHSACSRASHAASLQTSDAGSVKFSRAVSAKSSQPASAESSQVTSANSSHAASSDTSDVAAMQGSSVERVPTRVLLKCLWSGQAGMPAAQT